MASKAQNPIYHVNLVSSIESIPEYSHQVAIKTPSKHHHRKKDVGIVGVEVSVNEIYLSDGFKGNLLTKAGTNKTALRMRFIPRGLAILLIGLLACFSCYGSRSFAEEQAGRPARIEGSGRTVQEAGNPKMPETQPRRNTVLVLHTLKAKRPWNVLFNRYFVEALREFDLSLDRFEIEHLDLLQFNDASYHESVKKQLEIKYGNAAPDIIIITFASTIKFVLENDLFSGIPKILVLPTSSGFDEIPNSVVLPFAFDFKKNIEHALTLMPDTKRIYVVAGNGLMDRRLASLFHKETEAFRNRVSLHD